MTDALWDSRSIAGKLLGSVRSFRRLASVMAELTDDVAAGEIHHITTRSELNMKDLDLHLRALMTFSKDIEEFGDWVYSQIVAREETRPDEGNEHIERHEHPESSGSNALITSWIKYSISKFQSLLAHIGPVSKISQSLDTISSQSLPSAQIKYNSETNDIPSKIRRIASDIVEYVEGLKRFHVVHDKLLSEKDQKVINATPEERSQIIHNVITAEPDVLEEVERALRQFSRYAPTV